MGREAGPLIIEGEVCADNDSSCSWEVYSDGSSDEDLRDEADVTKVDQDGGEVCTLSYADAPAYVQKAIDRMIESEVDRANREMNEAARDWKVNQGIACGKEERGMRRLDSLYAQADRLRKQAKGE